MNKKSKKFVGNMKDKRVLLMMFLTLFFVFMTIGNFYVSKAVSWYDTGWGYRKKITIDHTKVSGTLTDFPVYVEFTDNDLRLTYSGGHVGKSNGGDILFTASNGVTKYSHELQNYDFASGVVQAWVKIPSLSSTVDTEIYLYYGNEFATDQWETDGNTWSSNYSVVHHYQESCSTSNCLKNSADPIGGSESGTPLRAGIGKALYTAYGKVGGAIDLSGNFDYVSVNDSADLDFTDDFTISGWFKVSEGNRFNSLFEKGAYALKFFPDSKLNFVGRHEPSGHNWTETESFGTGMTVTSFAVFNDYIYATVKASTPTNTQISRSTDSESWTTVKVYSGLPGCSNLDALTVFKSNLYAICDDFISYSANGTTWNTAVDLNYNLGPMAVFNGYLYVATVTDGRVYRSVDGTSWSLAKDFTDLELIKGEAFTVYNGYLYLINPNGDLYYSSNGTSWTLENDFGFQTNSLSVYDGKLWVGGVENDFGVMYYKSYEGSWTASDYSSANSPDAVGVFGERFYAGSDVIHSKGVSGGWSLDEEPVGISTISAIADVSGTLLVGAGNSGKVFRRDDVGFTDNTTVSTGAFKHLVITYDKDLESNNLLIYLDGSNVAQLNSNLSLYTNDSYLLIGGSFGNSSGGRNSSGEEFLKGAVDEFRISNGVKTSAWITTEYTNQNAPASFSSLGIEEVKPTDGGGGSGGSSTTAMSSKTSAMVTGEIGNGSLVMSANGSLASGLMLRDSVISEMEQSATWVWDEPNDYFWFKDTTALDGFKVRVYMTSAVGGDFAYTGESVEQASIPVENFKLFANFDMATSATSSPNKGLDSSDFVLDLDTLDTCFDSENVDKYSFNSAFYSGDYGLAMSSTAQDYFVSQASCVTEGTFDLRKVRLTIPAGSAEGTYSSDLVFVVLDGE